MQSGRHRFDIEVRDAEGRSNRASYGIEIRSDERSTLTFTPTTSLPAGEVGTPYAATLFGSGGSKRGYAWTTPRGGLPPDLILSSQGTSEATIAGTPFAAGAYNFDVELRDDAGASFVRSVSIDIARFVEISITTTSSASGPWVLPPATVRVLYETSLSAENGRGEYRWEIIDGDLPPGLALEPKGTPSTRLFGAPTSTGTYEATVAVFDDRGRDARAVRLKVGLPPLTVNTSTLATARICQLYEALFTASGGDGGPYHWFLDRGNLPPGFRFEALSSNRGRVYGAALEGQTGLFRFRVRAADASGTTGISTLQLRVMDDGTGHKWVALTGRFSSSGEDQLAATNICTDTPTPVRPVPTRGQRPIANTLSISPDGRLLAYTVEARSGRRNEFELWSFDLHPSGPNTPVPLDDRPVPSLSLSWSPNSRRLVHSGGGQYSSDRVDIYGIDTSRIRSSYTPTRLSPQPLVPTWIYPGPGHSFSADNRWVIFGRNDGDRRRLWVYDFDGGGTGTAEQVAPQLRAGTDSHPVWDPTRQARFLFACDCHVPGRPELYLASISNGSVSTRIISHPLGEGVVSVNPADLFDSFGFTKDGNYAFYYPSFGNSPTPISLYRIDLSDPMGRGEAVFRAPTSNRIGYTVPVEGSRILVKMSDRYWSLGRIYLFDLSGPTLPSIAAREIGGGHLTSGPNMSISPDRRKLVFYSPLPPDQGFFLVNLTEANPRPIRLDPPGIRDIYLYWDDFGVEWAPTSDRVLFHGNADSSEVDAYVLDLGSGGPTLIPLAVGRGRWDRRSRAVWRIDGRAVVRNGRDNVIGLDGLYLIKLANPRQPELLTPVDARLLGRPVGQ